MPLRPPKSWLPTLRLPKSSFPPRPSLASQAEYLRKCSDDLYEWQSRERAAQKPFILHDGPPYANGDLHVGHALNRITKDIICRVKLQQGDRVVYVPGWDCHGLPIEIKALEKQWKESENGAVTLDALGIRRVARSLASKTVKQQMKSLKDWGIMADWESAWRTMDKQFELKQLSVFQEMVKKGLIFRRYKPVYWSPSSRTALAEAELEYNENHISTAAFVRFPIVSIPAGIEKLSGLKNLSAVIWTTTPWTLPANRVIAVHKAMEYSVVKHGENHLIISKPRLPDVLKSCFKDDEPEVVVDLIMGSEIQGLQYKNPLRGQDANPQPIIHAEFVSSESGSGLVHCAPGHGMDDYEVCNALGIQADAPVDDYGQFTSAALPDKPEALAGKPVLGGGSKAVLEVLGDLVINTHKYKHKYPYDWRTKLPVIVRATEQWFADVGSVKSAALDALKSVTFLPETGRSRLESFVRGRSEWCISRQRVWGVPIPALYDEHGKALLTESSVAHIVSVIDDRGIDAWWTDAPEDPAWTPPGVEGAYTRGKDTMDVWFDSGSSWAQTDRQADVYLEGTDQHRGWFQSSLLTHVCASKSGTAPFKTLITHGFTLDQAGKKMSKSLGNIIAPTAIMDGSLLPPPKKGKKGSSDSAQGLGADALRLWAASSDYTTDVVIGQSVLKSVQSSLLKYRVTLKMLLGSMHQAARNAPLTKLDQIALVQLEDTMAEVAKAFDQFEFHRAVSIINRYISIDLSAFYLEAMRDRLYCADGGGVLEEIFQALLRMLAPITPGLVEEAWDHRPEWMKAESQLHPFHRTLDQSPIDPDRSPPHIIRRELPFLLAARSAIKAVQEEARARKLIGSSLEASVVLDLPLEACELFEKYFDELDTIFVVSSVKINSEIRGGWEFSQKFDAPGGNGVAWIVPPENHKCPRCWRYVAPVEDELCGRCEDAVKLL